MGRGGRGPKKRKQGPPPNDNGPEAAADPAGEGPPGLRNLGNTCFLNSTLQCLARATPMADALLAVGRKRRAWRVPRETPRRASSGSVSLTALDSEASAAPARGLGPLTWAVKRFLAAMRHLPAHDAVDPGLGEKDPFSVHSDAPRKRGKKGKLTGRPALADLDGPVFLPFHGHPHPDEVYHAVCEFAPRFAGYSQQDAHEVLRFLLDGVHEEERRRRARRRKSAEDPEGAAAGGGPQSAVEAAAGAYICTAVECTACGTKHRTFDPIFDASVPIVGSGDDVDPRRSRLRGKQKRWKRQQDGNVAAPGKPQRGANAGRHISKKERKRLAREARQKEKEEGAVAARSRQESRDKKKRAKAGVELEPSSPEDAYAKLNEAAAALERLEHAAGWAESAGKRELVDFCQATASDAFLASRGLRGTVKAVAKTFRASVLQACAVELIRAHEMVWQAGGPSALRSGPAQGSGRRGDGKEQEAQAEGVDGSEANGEASEKGRVDEFTPADGARDGAPAPGPGCGAAAGELPSAEVCAGVAAGSGALAPGAASPSGTDVCSVAASGGGDGPTEQEGEEAGDSKPDDPFVDPAEPSRHVPAPGEEITLSMCLDEFVRSEMLRTSDGNGYSCRVCAAWEGAASAQGGGTRGEDGDRSYGDATDHHRHEEEEEEGGGGGSGEGLEPAVAGDAGHCEGGAEGGNVGDGAGEDGLPQPADGGEEQGSEEVGEVYRDASLRVLFATLPPVLTLHLKRFSRAMDGFLSKYTGHVTFPLELDMAPYCLREKREGPDDGVAAGGPGRPPRAIGAPLGQGSAQYRLVGVVEHAGGMAGGHYVAYVRGRGQGDAAWWRASDTSVRAIEENEVLRAQAYILFYECCG